MEGFDVRASYVRIRGFEITNRNQTEESGQGIRLSGAHNEVRGNLIHDLCFEGIFLDGGPGRDSDTTSENTISGNTIRAADMAGIQVEGRKNLIARNDISQTWQYPAGCPNRRGADADGMRFFGLGHIFRENHIHDIALPGTGFNLDPHTDCFQTWGPAQDIIFERNWCEMPAPSVVGRAGNNFSNIENFAGPVGGLRFVGNVIINVGHGIIMIGDGPAPIDGLAFENNTADNILQEAVILQKVVNAHIANCIFYNVGAGRDNFLATDDVSAGFVAINNDMYMPDGSRPGTYGSNAGHLTVDPGFRNASEHDLRLSESSPVKGMGAELTRP